MFQKIDIEMKYLHDDTEKRGNSMTQVSFRVDDMVKTDAEALFERLGMSLSTALNIFLRQAIAKRALPFAVVTVVKSVNSASFTGCSL